MNELKFIIRRESSQTGNEFFKTQLNFISKTCKENRIKNKINQKDIATAIGCSPTLIRDFEEGKIDSAVIFYEYIEWGLFSNE